jgi:hypothetical protein
MVCTTFLTASAYSKKGWKISSGKTLIPHTNFSATSVAQMSNSVLQWNNEAGSTLVAIHTITHNTTGYWTNDSNNYIYREDAGVGYLAETSTWRNSSNQVTEFDININIYYPWANSAQPNYYDLYSVFLHEIGHPFGLGDLYNSSDSAAVMYYGIGTNQAKRSLTQDDKLGIADIY